MTTESDVEGEREVDGAADVDGAAQASRERIEEIRRTSVRVLSDTKGLLDRLLAQVGSSSFDELLFAMAMDWLKKLQAEGPMLLAPKRTLTPAQLARRLQIVEEGLAYLQTANERVPALAGERVTV